MSGFVRPQGPVASRSARKIGRQGGGLEMLTKLIGRCAMALLAVASLAGAAEARSIDDIIKSGTLRIGVNPNFPPMSSYGQTNQLEGFDIDVGNKLAEILKVKAEFVPTETAQR